MDTKKYSAFQMAVDSLARKMPTLAARATAARVNADARPGDAWFELTAIDAETQYKSAKERHDALVEGLKKAND